MSDLTIPRSAYDLLFLVYELKYDDSEGKRSNNLIIKNMWSLGRVPYYEHNFHL